MPIVVKCPCGAKLQVADAAAGKTVKCPKCKSALAIPDTQMDFELVPDEEAPPPKKKPRVVDEDEDDAPRPKRKPAPLEVNEAVEDDDEDEKPRKKKSRVVDDDEDEDEKPRKKSRRDEDEDEDDDRPRKKGKGKGGKKKAKSNLLLLLGIGGGVLALVFVGVVVAVVMMNGSPVTAKTPAAPTPAGPAGPVPPEPIGPAVLPDGWKKQAGDGFSVGTPEKSLFFSQNMPANNQNPGAGQPVDGKMWAWVIGDVTGKDPVVKYMVMRAKLPPETAAKYKQNPDAYWVGSAAGMSSSAFSGTPKVSTIRVSGIDARQLEGNSKGSGEPTTMQMVIKDDVMYVVGYSAPKQPGGAEPNGKAFFDSFRFE